MLVKTELKRLQKFDASYFRVKNYFDDDGTQNYLVFQAAYKYFEKTETTPTLCKISSWESKGLSNEKIIAGTKTVAPYLIYETAIIKVSFMPSILKQNKVTYNHGPIVNIYVLYRMTSHTKSSSIVLENCLFGAVKITKNANVDKYKYSGYGTGFDVKGEYTHPDGGDGKNVIIVGADLSNSRHANNITRNILVLGRDFIQKIDDTTIYAEKMY